MTLKTDLMDSIAEKFKAARDATKKNARAAIEELLVSFFEKYPTLEAVAWSQYTPYFNDGEACYFGVNEPHFKFKVEKKAPSSDMDLAEEDADEDDDDFLNWPDSWSFTTDSVDYRKPSPAGFAKDCKQLSNAIESSDEIMEMAFGDHVSVIVKRKKNGGLKFEVSEYSHD